MTQISDSQKQAVAAFAQHYMYALSGMQLHDVQVRTIDPHQFAVSMMCGIYAVTQLKEEGLLDQFPDKETTMDYPAFGRFMAERYADQMTDVAVGFVSDLKKKMTADKLEADMRTALESLGGIAEQMNQEAQQLIAPEQP